MMDSYFLRRLVCVVCALIIVAAPRPGLGQTDRSTTSPPATPFTASVPVDTAAVEFDRSASTEELLGAAREMFIGDNYPLAEMLYKSVLIREPNNLSAMLELAIVYEAVGKLQYARGLLARATILSPYDEEIIKRNAEINLKMSAALEAEIDSLFAQKAYNLVLPRLSVLLTTQPENSDLYYKKAQCHLEMGRAEAAISEIDKALNLRIEQKYYDIKDRAMAAIKSREVKDLTLRARRHLNTDTVESDDKALQLIAQILEIEPDNTWAREQFVALTEENEARRSEGTALRFSAVWARLKALARPVGNVIVGVTALFYRHIEMLLTILIVLLILHSPFTHMLVRGFSPRQSLTGRLNQYSIHEILTLINTHNRTGVLKLKTQSATGRIYFSKGEIYHCKCKGETGRDALQYLLSNTQEGYFVFIESASSNQKTIDTPLSLILMELPERDASVASKGAVKRQRSKMKSLLGSKS